MYSCVFEVFGSAAPEVLQLLEGWGRAARSKTPPGEEPPCMVGSQPLSHTGELVAAPVQGSPARRPAIEILNRVDGE